MNRYSLTRTHTCRRPGFTELQCMWLFLFDSIRTFNMNEIKKLNDHKHTRLLQMFRFVIVIFHSVGVVSPRAELYFFYVIYEDTGLLMSDIYIWCIYRSCLIRSVSVSLTSSYVCFFNIWLMGSELKAHHFSLTRWPSITHSSSSSVHQSFCVFLMYNKSYCYSNT